MTRASGETEITNSLPTISRKDHFSLRMDTSGPRADRADFRGRLRAPALLGIVEVELICSKNR